MYLDIATIFVKAGNGGDGIVSFHTEKYVAQGGPDGGDGGNGGDVIFVVDKSASTLIDFKFAKHFRAENGENGGAKNCKGKSGKPLYIKVPRGTIIKEKSSGSILADMYYDDSEFLLQRGGLGGKGNARFATAQRKAPRFSQRGERTQEIELTLELKTIADVGLVGFPNVGKSTILSVVSSAKPKIANYHFTTLTPNLGVVKYYDRDFVLADIPGLIEGASEGAGLGHNFLRHVERVRLIVHVVDISGIEGRDPYEDFVTINGELENYSAKLARLPQIVVANKCDLLEDERVIEEFEKKIGQKVVRVSAISNSGTKEMLSQIVDLLDTLPQPEPMETVEFDENRNDTVSFIVTIDEDGVYEVHGGLINMLVRNVVLDDYESFRYFQKTLKDRGVIKELVKYGCKEGDTVRIADIEFDFVE
ncbi:MAG: GTPase ObgE [Clostridia bacterium]|jgi:GTP-binding protein|nr:GTPase ObgE [Clostridia bacterium]